MLVKRAYVCVHERRAAIKKPHEEYGAIKAAPFLAKSVATAARKGVLTYGFWPITVAGPWPIRTAFPHIPNVPVVGASLFRR